MNDETEVVEEKIKLYYLHITMKTIAVVRYDERLSREEYLILQGYPGKTVDYSGRKSTVLTTRLEEKDLSPESVAFLSRMKEIGVIQGWTIEETEESKY